MAPSKQWHTDVYKKHLTPSPIVFESLTAGLIAGSTAALSSTSMRMTTLYLSMGVPTASSSMIGGRCACGRLKQRPATVLQKSSQSPRMNMYAPEKDSLLILRIAVGSTPAGITMGMEHSPTTSSDVPSAWLLMKLICVANGPGLCLPVLTKASTLLHRLLCHQERTLSTATNPKVQALPTLLSQLYPTLNLPVPPGVIGSPAQLSLQETLSVTAVTTATLRF